MRTFSIVTKLINQITPTDQTAPFLHVIGPDAQSIYNIFLFTATERKDDLDTVKDKFDQHFIG